jgi:hypothetical protein
MNLPNQHCSRGTFYLEHNAGILPVGGGPAAPDIIPTGIVAARLAVEGAFRETDEGPCQIDERWCLRDVIASVLQQAHYRSWTKSHFVPTPSNQIQPAVETKTATTNKVLTSNRDMQQPTRSQWIHDTVAEIARADCQFRHRSLLKIPRLPREKVMDLGGGRERALSCKNPNHQRDEG